MYSWLIKILEPNATFDQQEIVNVLCYGEGEGDQESRNKVFIELKNTNISSSAGSEDLNSQNP